MYRIQNEISKSRNCAKPCGEYLIDDLIEGVFLGGVFVLFVFVCDGGLWIGVVLELVFWCVYFELSRRRS